MYDRLPTTTKQPPLTSFNFLRRWPRENLGWAAACYCVWQPNYLNALWWSRCKSNVLGHFSVSLEFWCNDADKLKLCEVWGFSDTKEREVKEMEMTELWPVLRLDISVSSIACCWKIFKMQATTAICHLYIWCAYNICTYISYIYIYIFNYIYIHFLFTSTQIYQPTNPSIYLWIIYRLAVQLHSE